MVHSAPLNELKLIATSAADDAAFVALADVAMLLGKKAFGSALLIGVAALAKAQGLSAAETTARATRIRALIARLCA